MKVFISKYHNYCSGVVKAIRIAKEAKDKYQTRDVYVLGMLVHNDDVIKMLSDYGINSLLVSNQNEEELLSGLKKGSVIIFTAHGHKKSLDELVTKLELISIDATCSRVKTNLTIISDYVNRDIDVIYIGKEGHPETNAALALGKKVHLFESGKTFNYSQLNSQNPLVINQTTLSFLELSDIHKEITSHLKNPFIIDEICDETHKRQLEALKLPLESQLIYVVGGATSSNTNKLFEIVASHYKDAKVKKILNISQINDEDLRNIDYVSIVSGASTPSSAVIEISKYLKNFK
jgi:4-hydroxy-3-methylbut-2-en-1-yl diphosphate reductase